MEQPITDYVEFLNEAKQAVIDVNRMQEKEETLRQRIRQSKKELESAQKEEADQISQTIRKRVEELTSSYDRELAKGQERLRRARSKREKAKSQGVRERIEEETSQLRDDNRQLKLQLKVLFQQNRISPICRTRWYYALFMPHWFTEYIKLLVLILLCFLVLPYGSYLAIPNRKPLYLAGLYFLCIVVFGGLYVLIGNKTRGHHAEALKEGRLILNQMHSNDKKMKVIVHMIKKDRNEAVYDLQKHDDEIAQAEQEMSEIAAKKQEALNTFEKVTKTIISDEISSNYKDRIAYLRGILETEEGELKELTDALKTQVLDVTDRYEPYLGKEFLNPTKLEALKNTIESGICTNLTEAISEYKNNHA
ncbi:MAG: hypothetical protein ACLT46_04325 [Hungatella sp.]